MALVAAAQAGSLAAMRRREDAKPQTYIVPASSMTTQAERMAILARSDSMLRRLSLEQNKAGGVVVYASESTIAYEAARTAPFAACDDAPTTRAERLSMLMSSQSMSRRLSRVEPAPAAADAAVVDMPALTTREERLSLLLQTNTVMGDARAARRRSSAAAARRSAGHRRPGRSAACVVS